jgi:cytochrome bd ubiquinol oxidase subunit I
VSALDLARLQFAATTIYHFLFVPVTIGLVFVVAAFETAYVRTMDERWLRLTRFFGRLFLINFAIGVATGIVQEFQFGMNWSSYSRFVGDIFGAPLAMEGLAAFALESTFIGLWVFGWHRMRPALHAAMMWLTGIGTVISAYFILAANAWMQHPVGYHIDQTSGRAVLTDIIPVLLQPLALLTLVHTLIAAAITAGAVILAVAAWQMLRRGDSASVTFGPVVRIALVVLLVASAAQAVVGDQLGMEMVRNQPMKVAAAEGLWDTEGPASFSVLQAGGWEMDSQQPAFSIDVPSVLSFLATKTLDGPVEGINELQAQYVQQYGPGEYYPDIRIAYWSWRAMIYPLGLLVLLAVVGLVFLRRRTLARHRWFLRLSIAAVGLPFVMSTAGWVFTETARQPWVVYGLMRTADGISPTVPAWMVAVSLVVFVALYGALAVVNYWLLARYARRELTADDAESAASDGTVPLVMNY